MKKCKILIHIFFNVVHILNLKFGYPGLNKYILKINLTLKKTNKQKATFKIVKCSEVEVA